MIPVNLTGLGTCFPDRRMKTAEFDYEAAGVAADRVARSGIVERRWAGADETILDLAERAGRAALWSAGLKPGDVDRLILVTSTFLPDIVIPTGAAVLHDRLGLKVSCHATALVETCPGALVAMELGAGLVRAGQAKHVLVIASETFSKTFNPTHPLSFEIGMAMGDGAGAVVLSGGGDAPDGLLASLTRSCADFQGGLGIRATPLGEQQGKPVAGLRFGLGRLPPLFRGEPLPKEQLVEVLKKFTTSCVPVAITEALAAAGLSKDAVDFFVLHQPNRTLVESWRKAAQVPAEKTLDTLESLGNLSSVSLLANLEVAWRTRRIAPGNTVLLATVGEGMSWGAAIWKWRLPAPVEVVSSTERTSPMVLKDRVAVVAGGSKGIGRAVSLRYAREGAAVVVVARGEKEIDETVAAIRKQGGRAMGFRADCAKPAEVDALIRRVKEEYGGIDILANVVGGGQPELLARASDAYFDQMVDLNIRTTFVLSRAMVPVFLPKKYGKIIHTASIGAKTPSPGLSVYDGCKAFVVAFTRDLAVELGRHGVNVNCVCPGHIPTDNAREVGMKLSEIAGMPPEQMQAMLAMRMAIPKLPTAEDIAGLYVFLASPAADFMTGQAINFSGGIEMR